MLYEEYIDALAEALLEMGGQAAGSMEVASTPVEEAYEWAKEHWQSFNRDLDTEIPNFKQNYKIAQTRANRGTAQRRDMPVITAAQAKLLQRRLQTGQIDRTRPFADTTDPKDPFPTGLSGEQAREWLKAGWKDSNRPDDVTKATIRPTRVRKLKPIQKQIYVDKALGLTGKYGVKESVKFMKESLTVASADNFIIDGHHRWLQATIIDPNIPLPVLKIQLPIGELLPLSAAYGDALGNKRNA